MKKYRPFISGIIVGVFVAIALIYMCGGGIMAPGRRDYYTGLDKAYGKYYEIIELIDEEALAEYDPEKITDKVLKKVVAGLEDPYAQYYTAEEYEQFLKRYAKSYVGVGVTIVDKDDEVRIINVVEDSPAEEAGLLRDDVILAVDGDKVENSDDAVGKIAGESGTEVKVTIERDGSEKEFAVNRGKVVSKSVEYKELDKKNGIGYIKVSSFKTDTAKEFKLAVKDLKNANFTKLIIDLRENGGGSTDEAYKIADMLLPECEMLKEYNNKGEERVRKSDSTTIGMDYVLLVCENSASASEMVSGAVKDNKGGKLIGVKTFGKGVTQKTTKFKDGSALKITIEEFKRPSGKAINEVGIDPDIVVRDVHNNKKILSIAKKELMKK